VCILSVLYAPRENLFGDFNEMVKREDIFKPTIGNDSLHKTSNDNGVGVANATKSSFQKYSVPISPKILRYNGLVLMENTFRLIASWQTKNDNFVILDVRSCRGADCDNDCYLVVAELRERLSVSK
jgi:hypothetical protein